MRYYTAPAFDKSVEDLSEDHKKRVKKAIDLAVAFFETGDLPHGLGLKPLGHSIWEIRAGLSERVLFRKNKEVIEFLLAGSHDDVKQYLKRF